MMEILLPSAFDYWRPAKIRKEEMDYKAPGMQVLVPV
jgi:hypothetical protein